LEGDLGKLTRWMEQIRARDYFREPAADAVVTLLARCEEALAVFMETAASEDVTRT
jgi:hypothetical protein